VSGGARGNVNGAWRSSAATGGTLASSEPQANRTQQNIGRGNAWERPKTVGKSSAQNKDSGMQYKSSVKGAVAEKSPIWCTEMCPDAEREEREFEGDLHELEVCGIAKRTVASRSVRRQGPGESNIREVPVSSREKAVKKYRRSAAGRDLGSDSGQVRDIQTLRRTTTYLVQNIMVPETRGAAALEVKGLYDEALLKFTRAYEFASDRFRAVRQDMSVVLGHKALHNGKVTSQGVMSECGDEESNVITAATPEDRLMVVELLQAQIVVHMCALLYLDNISNRATSGGNSYLTLQRNKVETSSHSNVVVSFERKLCLEQISQCLAPLLQAYDGFPSQEEPSRENLFRALALMIHGGDGDLAVRLTGSSWLALREETRKSSEMRSTLALVRCWRCSNVQGVTKALQALQAWPLLTLAASAVLADASARALETMNSSFTHREPMPLPRLAKLLGFLDAAEDESLVLSNPPCNSKLAFVEHVCRSCGLEISDIESSSPPSDDATDTASGVDEWETLATDSKPTFIRCVTFKSANFSRTSALTTAWQGNVPGAPGGLATLERVMEMIQTEAGNHLT